MRLKKISEFIFEAKDKSVNLPNSNLLLHGFGMDNNGNHIVRISYVNQRSFSYQTNNPNFFKNTNRIGKEYKSVDEISEEDLLKIEKEVIHYIKNFGSKKEKEPLKEY